MMTQRSARASVALQLGSSPVRHQLHQNIVYIENFQFIYPVNKLFFVSRKSSLKWLFVGRYRTVVPRYRPTLRSSARPGSEPNNRELRRPRLVAPARRPYVYWLHKDEWSSTLVILMYRSSFWPSLTPRGSDNALGGGEFRAKFIDERTKVSKQLERSGPTQSGVQII